MQQNYFFKNAKWVGAADPEETRFSILRGHFTASDASKVSLNVLGLGFFKCYINGTCVNPDSFRYFLKLSPNIMISPPYFICNGLCVISLS